MLVKVKLIGLVNILAGEKLVEELVQCDADPGRVEDILSRLMTHEQERLELCSKLGETAAKLGEPGAHVRAANEISRYFQTNG
jgi:lipid-A-disaccharide synthase